MLEICALASGSNGNCYYIGNEKEAVLIDAGIFYKHFDKRMDEAGLDKNKIKAIFITHEHTDHVQGVRGCSDKLNVPVFFTQKTFKKLQARHRPDMVMFFESGTTLQIGDLTVFSFKKLHDAADPCSFRIEGNGKSVGVMTDIGSIDQVLENEIAKCHAVFLETNYDQKMLWNGSYPVYLKQRVDSELGHLSNDQALELIKRNASDRLKYIFLSHISAENNRPEIAIQVFNELNHSIRILPTSRKMISEKISL